jgi:hypothetical protein
MQSEKKSICMTTSNDGVPPPRLASWAAGRRIAFELRYAIAVALDRGLPSATQPSLGHLKKIIADLLAKADQFRTELPSVELVKLELLELRSMRLATRDASAFLIEKRLKEFCDRVDNALDHLDKDHVPTDVHLIFRLVEEFVRGACRLHCEHPIVRPMSYLELGYMDSDGGPTAPVIKASCRVQDGTAPISVIKLDVRDDCLNWSAVCRLPYIFTHELLCHGYQGTFAFDAEEPRKDVDSDSAWTEGWMDSVAMLVTENWISRHIGDPEWVFIDGQDLVTATRQASKERCEPQQNLKPEDRSQRRAANRAAMRLMQEMTRVNSSPDKHKDAKRKLLKFSLTFNSLRIPNEDRDRLARRLGYALEALTFPANDELLGILERFCVTRDWKWMDEELHRLTVFKPFLTTPLDKIHG